MELASENNVSKIIIYTNKTGELSGRIITYTLNEGNCAAQLQAPPRLEHLRAPPIWGIASVIM